MPHEVNDFNIRLTEKNTERVMEVMDFYLTDKYMVWYHKPVKNPENEHHHIYLFGLHRQPKAIREFLFRLGYPKTAYEVKTTCGGKKNMKITPEGAYQYGAKPDSQPVLVRNKGFTDEELQKFKEQADRYYNPPIVARPEDSQLPEVVFKIDRVWERLKANKTDYKDMTVKAIKSKLCADWLNDGKAIPRPSDCHRYAVSLYYINKFNDSYVPDNALMEDGQFD